MRKPQSTKKKLILPTSLAFVFLVAAMIAAAFSLFSTSVTSSTNEQTLAASEQVLTNYESYFDSVITVSNNVLGTYSNASETSLAQDMRSYFDTLETFINSAFMHLRPGGRLAIISFHSLEDRIVKLAFKAFVHDQKGVLVTKKPIIASEAELKMNPRARSAKLRVIEKIV